MLETLTARLVRMGGVALARTQAAAERGGGIGGFTRFVRLLVQSGVMGLGAWLVLERELTPGGMLAASILASKALAPVEQMVATWKTVGTARESWARLRELLSAAPPAPRTLLPAPVGQLAVEGATVRTADGRALLHDVAFRLEAGECLVVVGPSGAGKSTLCRLLGRHRPARPRCGPPGRGPAPPLPGGPARLVHGLPAAGGGPVAGHDRREHRPHERSPDSAGVARRGLARRAHE